MMLLVIGLVIILGYLFSLQLRLRRAAKVVERALAATYYYCDMGKLFLDLSDDPFMTSAKWREWLPLFEDADRHYAETHPYLGDFFRYAEAVKREIDDLPLQKVGSS